jgi:hypothetical protein
MYPSDQPVLDRGLAALRLSLGEDRLAVAREAGRLMSVEQATAEAREVAAAVAGSVPAEGGRPGWVNAS